MKKTLYILLLLPCLFFSQTTLNDYEKYFNDNQNAMLYIDPSNGDIVKANKAAKKFYGYEDLTSMKIQQINTFTINQVKQEMQKAKSEKRNYFIFNHKLSNGSTQKVRVFSSPIQYKNKRVLYSTIYPLVLEKEFIDNFNKSLEEQINAQTKELQEQHNKTTIFLLLIILLTVIILLVFTYYLKQKVKLQKSLEKQKEEFEKLFNFAPIAMALSDENGNVIEINNSFINNFGYTRKDIPDIKTWFEKAYPKEEYRLHVMDLWNKALEETTEKDLIGPIEVNITAKDKKVYDIEILSLNFNNGFLVVFIDQTMKNRLLKDTIEQKEELETIFNYSQDGIAVIDLESKFLNYNDSYSQITDYSKEELKEKSCLDLCSNEDKIRMQEALELAAKHGQLNNLEISYISKENNRIVVNNSLSLLPDKKSFLIVTKNMTSLKLLEEQSRLASMGEMIGNIAHQWRQPLTVITTNASGLKLKYELQELDKEYLDESIGSIMKQSNYLSNTIENFKNFIKGENRHEEISIKEVIENTLSLTEASFKNNFIHTIIDIDDDIRIDGNKNELVEAFVNILNNAKDILKKVENEDDRFLFIETKKIDEFKIELLIKDSGGGIKDEIIERIFEPYFTTKHQSQGTGLGLALSDKIIRERHHGILDVKNETFMYKDKEYKGACFSIIL